MQGIATANGALASPAPPPNVPPLYTPRQFVARHPALAGKGGSLARVRWQIFNSATNGLEESGALVRIPGPDGSVGPHSRILIDEQRYFAWLLAKGRNAA